MSSGVVRTVGALGAVLCLSLCAPDQASAHKTSLADIDVAVEGSRVLTVWTTSAHDLAVVLGIETDLTTPVASAEFDARSPALKAYVGERTIIRSDNGDCIATDIVIGYEKLPEQVVVRSVFECANKPTTLAVRYGFYFDVDSQHLCVGRIHYAGRTQEVVFDVSFMEIDVDVRGETAAPSSWVNIAVYVWFGAQHILVGYDHLLFLLALIIVLPSMWRTFKIVTAFTIAHSVTLSLAWFDILSLPSRLVESAIALSVAYVAVENLFRKRLPDRWILAGCFGLVHGLGFYGALSALGANSQNMLLVLFTFNLGVEIGQVLVVLMFYLPLYFCAKYSWFPRAVKAASLAMFVTAMWWFFQRAFGS